MTSTYTYYEMSRSLSVSKFQLLRENSNKTYELRLRYSASFFEAAQ